MAQTRVRVSVKHILSASGSRSSGSYTTDSQVQAAITTANQVLANNGITWTLLLTEVVDVAGVSSYYNLSGSAEMRALETAARANPSLYQWRSNAINIYVVNDIVGFGGICSFPMTDEIIAINNGDGILNGGVGWLHEIGHYLSLTHTFESCHLPSGAGAPETIGLPEAQGVPGDQGSNCTGAGATHTGFCGGIQTCSDICPDSTNVMSYNFFSASFAEITPCQRGHMELELFDVAGSRSHVVSIVIPCLFAAAVTDTRTFPDARGAAQTGELLYSVRDDLLNRTPQGASWVELYYKHGPAMVRIAREKPRVRRRFAALLAVLTPGLRALTENPEQAESIRVPAAAVALLDSILDDFEQAEPESALARAIRAERVRLGLSSLAGKTYAAAWREMNGETELAERDPR